MNTTQITAADMAAIETKIRNSICIETVDSKISADEQSELLSSITGVVGACCAAVSFHGAIDRENNTRKIDYDRKFEVLNIFADVLDKALTEVLTELDDTAKEIN